MMTPIMMNALLSGLLATACFSAFADQSDKQNTTSNEGILNATYSTPAAPASDSADASQTDEGLAAALVRTSADSMHPNANPKPRVADDYQVDTYQTNGE